MGLTVRRVNLVLLALCAVSSSVLCSGPQGRVTVMRNNHVASYVMIGKVDASGNWAVIYPPFGSGDNVLDTQAQPEIEDSFNQPIPCTHVPGVKILGYSLSMRLIVFGTGFVSLVAIVGCMAGVIVYRVESVIKAASVQFLFYTLCGLLLLCVCGILMAITPHGKFSVLELTIFLHEPTCHVFTHPIVIIAKQHSVVLLYLHYCT